MSGNEWWSTKVGAKLMSDLAIFSSFSSNIPLDFHDSTRVMLVKYLMYFLAGINMKQFWNISKEKYFAPLIILNSTKFIYIALTFFDSLFNLFLFDIISFSLLVKSIFFTKLLLAKFVGLNLAAKFCNVNLLNFGLV